MGLFGDDANDINQVLETSRLSPICCRFIKLNLHHNIRWDKIRKKEEPNYLKMNQKENNSIWKLQHYGGLHEDQIWSVGGLKISKALTPN